MKFSELAHKCSRHLETFKGYSPHTIAAYETTAKQFGFFLAHAGLTDDLKWFTDEHVLNFSHWLGDQGVKPSTIIARLSGLRAIATFGMKDRDQRGKPRLATDPTAAFEWPEAQRADTHFLRTDELTAVILLDLPLHLHVMRAVFIETGLRVSEIIRANVGDVTRTPLGHSLSITVKGRGRRAERRYTPLSVELVDLLNDWLLSRNLPEPGEPLLLSVRGQRWTRSAVSDAILKLGRKAGIARLRLHPHVFRHTSNVTARVSGLDQFVRARLLNHSSTASQERYDHLLPGELHAARTAALQGMAAYLGNPAIMSSLYAARPSRAMPNTEIDQE